MASATLTLPASGGDIVGNRINQDGYATEYLSRGATLDVRVRVRHTKTNAKGDTPSFDRHNVEITKKVFADGTDPEVNSKVYLVIEHVPGDDPTELVDALSDWLIATANAKVTDLLGWEEASD
jgi:RES domain-containing protein